MIADEEYVREVFEYIEALTNEISGLHDLIAKAPHDMACALYRCLGPCNCWKNGILQMKKSSKYMENTEIAVGNLIIDNARLRQTIERALQACGANYPAEILRKALKDE